MLLFLMRRLMQGLIVMFVISIISFSIQDNLGDPLRELVGQSVSEAERERLRDEMGLNDPFLTQYTRFMGKALQGDLGQSYFFKEPALDVIFAKMPATLELVFAASLIIILVSIPAGVYCAIRPNSWFTKLILGFSILGISVPVFLTAIFSIYLFSIELGWLPSYGRGELVPVIGGWESGLFTKDGLLHLILPAISLASIMLPLFIRLIRSEMSEVLHTEYVKFAKAKGLKKARIYFLTCPEEHHAARYYRGRCSDRNHGRLYHSH